VLSAGLFAAACNRPSYADTKPQQPAPPITTAVGPVPGPNHSAVRRRNPFFENRDARGEGRQLFVRFNCSGCHGGRAGGGMGPSLRDVDWIYGSDDAQIFSSIAEGRAHGMPSWESKLTDDEVWKIVTYIKSLRTKDEIDPPA
jgi:cytochrome c oxidase cbb3-type subunit 3